MQGHKNPVAVMIRRHRPFVLKAHDVQFLSSDEKTSNEQKTYHGETLWFVYLRKTLFSHLWKTQCPFQSLIRESGHADDSQRL